MLMNMLRNELQTYIACASCAGKQPMLGVEHEVDFYWSRTNTNNHTTEKNRNQVFVQTCSALGAPECMNNHVWLHNNMILEDVNSAVLCVS
jgi:hypothetical protein